MSAAFEAPEAVAHALLLLDSHMRVVGRPLAVSDGSADERARALYFAPFVVLSHGTESDPLFNYGNAAAQDLFEFEWDQLIALPSRLSAETQNQAERQRALDLVASRGYVDDYVGIRVSRSGRRFRITGTTVWNVIDREGKHRGQAAAFATWTPIE
ncbi:MAG: MEKHLA domain-containing protein [Polyangiaceae bacterium]